MIGLGSRKGVPCADTCAGEAGKVASRGVAGKVALGNLAGELLTIADTLHERFAGDVMRDAFKALPGVARRGIGHRVSAAERVTWPRRYNIVWVLL